jgi:hypothetical protein
MPVGRWPVSRSRRRRATTNPSGPSRAARRQQRAALSEQLAGRDAALTSLSGQHRAHYELAAREQARPAAIFVGFRARRQVASISSRPSPTYEDLANRFTLACLALGALEVDWAALLAGDEFAVAVTDPADHPADGSLFVIALTVGPAGAGPAGTITPYQLDRGTGTLSWGAQRPVGASRVNGLWARVLAPMCLGGQGQAPVGPAAVTEYVALNQQVDNEVLLL